MATKFSTQTIAGRAGRSGRPGREAPAPAVVPRLTDRACCCLAKPAVVAVLPITGRDHRPVDLHLCVHHYRLSRGTLDEAGAVVFDGAGLPVADPDAGELLRTAR
ncbi:MULTISPECIES: hypothetical protein [unclassified Actinomadura]|uniref:hypothetical protein n=1 Tax=unclassified Actinomadura TaxID=2626254 RepID=UPI0011ED4DF8|nr:hypothetical protein [Actinomadura sp. K4S16]